MGKPITYLGKTLVWKNNRQLESYNGVNFTYDGLGRRISKGDINFSYDLEGRLIKQGSNIEFIYDNSGVSGIKYNGSLYLYRKNSQQDIVALLDNEENVVVRYLYDAWENNEVVDSSGGKY